MEKFVVLRVGGKQYKVSEGQEFLVDKIKDPKKLSSEVLLFVDGDKVKIGKPVLKDVDVKIKVLKDVEKGEKIRIYKYKAKSRERKLRGFRASYTRLLVEKIS